MKTKTILALLPFTDEQKNSLEAMAPDCRFIYPDHNELTQDMILSAHVILGSISVKRLADSHNLEWLQLNSAGAKEYVTSGLFPKQAVLTNATGAFGLAISEHMLAMLLMIQKKLHLYRDHQLRSEWSSEGTVSSIDGSTTLVIGLGDIGGEFAHRMKLLGSKTIGIKRHPTPKPDYLDELYLNKDLDRLLPDADVVALALPDTPETYHILNRARLTAMKKSSILLNVGRGKSIDTEALCDLMESDHILGAGLDVTDPEPLPEDHRLWQIKNAIITPHVSGGYNLSATRRRILQIAIDNFGRYLREEPLQNVVDFELGY
ncbi:MAG: D-2-hydroxyacid dehydrogenase [Bacillota bacterium]|nr:D-2-hydroxyacid dehydrogenase [Bacillota bacterium]